MNEPGNPLRTVPEPASVHLDLAAVLSHPLGLSIHDLDFVPDMLGEGYEHTTVSLGDDPDGETPGVPVVCTVIRHRPAGVDPGKFASRPALLFVHGMTDYFFQTHVAEHFTARGYAVYGIDLRKCGRSHRPGQTWHHVTSQSVYDEDLSVAVSLLGAGHPYVIPVGHSTGGLDVTMFVSRLHAASRRGDPARETLYRSVAAVVLNSPWLDLQFNALTNAVIRSVFPVVSRHAPTLPVPGGIDPTYGRTLHVSEFGEWDYDRRFKPLRPRSKQVSWLVGVAREIGRLQSGGFSTGVPTLLVCSDADGSGRSVDDGSGVKVPAPEAFRSDTVLKPSQMRRAARLVDPGCVVVTVPGAVHDVFLSREDARDAAFAAVDRFLAQVVASRGGAGAN
ncbi:alpha/beta hydrolase [Corynebacterium provencense]|uniref:Serine aminopeptidase S33 domain-containing protein n=1 Tax=Corynebacterium provencense TaxID=1737425 RepID=A0A2Z3YNL9_9CORY|nr:alpha/beta hydrolase [Corynebacterium provencense]AWT25996.1 hypothetical protein Csp1_11960 [Corynebacterium provencense]